MVMVEGAGRGRGQARGPTALHMPRSVGKPRSTQHREQGVAGGAGRAESVQEPFAKDTGYLQGAGRYIWRTGLREELGGAQGSGLKVGERGVGGSALR